MIKKFSPINEKLPHFFHGGDYNPDQWLSDPTVLEEDLRMMKLAKCNVVSLGIFAWTALEPTEGVFTFEWLDQIVDKLYQNGIYIFLATPSGAKPAWLSAKYPEVLRVDENRTRNLHGDRHNHCFTSPVYREKITAMNHKLAQRYANHPALLGWHISNEYGGECHCNLCQDAFRTWLKKKYGTLEKLNAAWWNTFWSHTYTDWSQIESPSPKGENYVHGLKLDWKRFVTDQTIDFFKHEIAPLKAVNQDIPVTTNFMGTYDGLNYWKFTKEMDIVSWDNYPTWHCDDVNTNDINNNNNNNNNNGNSSNNSNPNAEIVGNNSTNIAVRISMIHDINRSLKNGKPFILMESTPSMTNWQPVSKLKRPGMHLLSSMQAVAHGADTVMYFQWRKSRGSFEKFHGAVVDHCGHENTRVFREVSKVGDVLEKLDEVIGTSIQPDVAIIYDWENKWAMNDAAGPRNCGLKYDETVKSHYKPFWKKGVPVDVIDMDCDFSKYKLLVAPMLYMIRPGVAERIEAFVKAGGTFVATYWSGIVDENDLCFLGGFPGPLRKVLGIWSEEIDALYDHDTNSVVFQSGNVLEIEDSFECRELCDLIHAEGADVLAVYQQDFYSGRPALTVNAFGEGKAYYIASRNDETFHDKFYGSLLDTLKLKRAIYTDTELPDNVTAQLRSDGEHDYVFLMNFSDKATTVNIGGLNYVDLLSSEKVDGIVSLGSYGMAILKS